MRWWLGCAVVLGLGGCEGRYVPSLLEGQVPSGTVTGGPSGVWHVLNASGDTVLAHYDFDKGTVSTYDTTGEICGAFVRVDFVFETSGSGSGTLTLVYGDFFNWNFCALPDGEWCKEDDGPTGSTEEVAFERVGPDEVRIGEKTAFKGVGPRSTVGRFEQGLAIGCDVASAETCAGLEDVSCDDL